MESIFQHDEFYQQILKSFATDLPGIFKNLKDAFEQGHKKLARDTSHKLAGTSATFGYPALAKAFQNLEMLLDDRDSTTPDIQEAIDHLGQLIQSVSLEGL